MTVSLDSSNLDRWSFKWNLEASQEIQSAPFPQVAAAVFDKDCQQSEQLDRRRWPERAWLDRLRERLTGALAAGWSDGAS